MPRARLSVAAAVLVAAAGVLIPLGPAISPRPDAIASAIVQLVLIALLVWVLTPLHALGGRLLVLFATAAVLSALLTWAGVAPLANVAKVVAAASLGIWIAENLEKVSWIVLVAVLSAAVDIVSVYAGPTKALLEEGPVVIGYFTVALAWMGYGYHEAYTALGLSDFVFFALYTRAAQRFALRAPLSVALMTASFAATIAAALWWDALPALPLLSAAFLAANADLLLRAFRRDGAGGEPVGGEGASEN